MKVSEYIIPLALARTGTKFNVQTCTPPLRSGLHHGPVAVPVTWESSVLVEVTAAAGMGPILKTL